MNQQNFYRVSVKGIVINEDGKVLLSLEDNGKWEILGGGLDHDEDPINCLRREILEETGLEVTSVSDAPLYFITSLRESTGTYTANIVYEIKLKSMDFVPSDECRALHFFSTEEMHSANLSPNVGKLLEILEQKR